MFDRLAWSLVHSSKLADVSLGLGMSQELLKDETDDQYRRDAMYYIAGTDLQFLSQVLCTALCYVNMHFFLLTNPWY